MSFASLLEEQLEVLEKTQEGRILIQRALSYWNETDRSHLDQWIKLGEASYTDTIITRHFHWMKGEEERKQETRVYVSQYGSWEEQILDLCHELVHALSPERIDPYAVALTPEKYIEKSIEGVGGEVDALWTECQVAQELSGILKRFFPSRCVSLQVDTKEQLKLKFYQVGVEGYEELQKSFAKKDLKNLGSLSASLSPRSPILFSSLSQLPYPLALYREFLVLNQTACRNSLLKWKQWESLPLPELFLSPFISKVSAFIEQRCL